MKIRTIPVILILICLTLLGSIWAAPLASDSLEDPALLRALAEHFAGVTIPRDELIVGGLPDSLPPGLLPIPNNAQILGSVVQGDTTIRVVLDSTQPPSAIESFYQEQLLNAGWQIQPAPVTLRIRNAGRAAQFGGLSPSLFCANTENATLRVSVRGSQPGQPIEIRLNIIPTDVISSPPVCRGNPSLSLSWLQLPEDVNLYMSSGGQGRSENSLYTDGFVEMSITSGALLAHLAVQFEQAGWKPVERVEDDMLSWASWTIESEQGETWQSVLNVIQLQGVSDQYLVRAQMERQENLFIDKTDRLNRGITEH